MQGLPYNYFGFRVEGETLFIRPFNDIFVTLIALATVIQTLRIYIKTVRVTTDVLIRRRRFSFFFATLLVSFGIIGVFLSAFMANVDMTLIYALLIFEIFILLAPLVLYYLCIFAPDDLARKFLMVK